MAYFYGNRSLKECLEGFVRDPHSKHVYCLLDESEVLEYYSIDRDLEDTVLRIQAQNICLRKNLVIISLNFPREYKGVTERYVDHVGWPEYLFARDLNTWFNDVKITKIQDQRFTKLFCCTINRCRPHKLDALMSLIESDLIDHGIVTLANNTEAFQDFSREFISKPDNIGTLSRLAPYFPQLFHTSETERFWQGHRPPIIGYDTCFAEIVPESNSKTTFFTEKTMKPLLFGKPFLIVGNRNQNKELTEKWDFVLYDSVFNYEFEDSFQQNSSFQDPYKPLNVDAICKIIEPLKELANEDFNDFYHKNCKGIAEHNRNVLIKLLFDDSKIPEVLFEEITDTVNINLSTATYEMMYKLRNKIRACPVLSRYVPVDKLYF